MKVLIVGAGIGGLTLAAFLKRCGIDFDIIERCPQWERQGFSLGIWDNGRDILKKLGLAGQFDAQSQPIREYFFYAGGGNKLRHIRLDDFYVRYGSGYAHIRRDVFHNMLLGAVGSRRVTMNTTVTKLRELKNKKIAVTFSNGSQGQYDVVVGADGVHSQVRRLAFSDSDAERYTQWRAWFIWTDRSFACPHGIVQCAAPGRFVSVFDDKEQALCVAVARTDHVALDPVRGRRARLEKLFNECYRMPSLLKGARPRTCAWRYRVPVSKPLR